MSIAPGQVIIHHSGGLHISIADGGANKLEATALKCFTHVIGSGRFCGYIGLHLPIVAGRLTSHKAPDKRIKTAKLFLHRDKFLGVVYRSEHLQTISYDGYILQQRFYFIRVITGNTPHIKMIKCLAVSGALFQNGNPA